MENFQITHLPVLKNEILDFFSTIQSPSPLFIDGTAGEGGHSLSILEKFPNSKVVILDRDELMLERAIYRLKDFNERVIPFNINFSEFNLDFLNSQNLPLPDGILLDLGISTFHIKNSERGFSFQKEEPLDMRLSSDLKFTAEDILNNYKSNKLEEVFLNYGEENWSRKIAQRIVDTRRKSPLKTTVDLMKIVEASIPRKFWPPKVHPSFRIFQAVRIEVNKELDHIEKGIPSLCGLLNKNGIFCVISFHSLEDRISKNSLKNLAKEKDYLILTKKPILPKEEEIEKNPASRSAKLRVLQANS